jgi:PPOX class probable F420-dependent enzyme
MAPDTSRPYMPGYGIEPAAAGLLPWSWAVERLSTSHDYWLATTRPDGRPHVMPVWAMWHDNALWFSSSGRSRKALNLRSEPRCVITTENPREPVVVEGVASVVTDLATLQTVLDLENTKYRTAYGLEMLNPCFRVRPTRVFGLVEAQFTTSPTRWTFASE